MLTNPNFQFESEIAPISAKSGFNGQSKVVEENGHCFKVPDPRPAQATGTSSPKVLELPKPDSFRLYQNQVQ